MAEENQQRLISRVWMEAALAIFVALTLVAIVAERFVLQTGFTVDAYDGMISVYNDSVDGGISTSAIIDPDCTEWRCVLADQALYSYCGFELIFDQGCVDGLKLRNYDRVNMRAG